MDRIENLISETLAERAGHAPVGPVELLHRSRRWHAAALSVAASAVIVAVAALGVNLHHSTRHGSQPGNRRQVSATRCATDPNAATPTAAGPASVLVPGNPIAAIRCEYGINVSSLVSSYDLDQAKTTQLSAALNQLVPDPCQCPHGGTPAPPHREILYFEYQDGSVLRIDGAVGENLDTWTNQTRTVANFSSSIVVLLNQLTDGD